MGLHVIKPSLLNDIFGRGVVELNGEQTLPLHSHLLLLECRLLQAWLTACKPRRVLEIGMAYGISSLAICEVLQHFEDVRFDIIDPHQRSDWQSVGIRNLTRAGFDGFYKLHEEPSEVCLPRFMADGHGLDFAFIDGWHSFDQVLVEFYYINRMLDTGGLVVFDDITFPGIQKACSFISKLECYRPEQPPDDFRIIRAARIRRLARQPEFRIVAFRKISPDVRTWHWYKEF
jgi:predicted O-methyltransferase YrrM